MRHNATQQMCPRSNGIVGTLVFLSSRVVALQASSLPISYSVFHPSEFHPSALCSFSPFSAPLLSDRFSLFPFSMSAPLPLFPLAHSRISVRINELGHGFLLQRDPTLGPYQLGYNRFEATAISDMRVQTNRQYSRDYTLFLFFPRQAQ